MTKTVQVEIGGQRYAIAGEADDAYIREVARYVDDLMRQLSTGMKMATPTKLAVLAAVNIAHQLFQSEQQQKQLDDTIERTAGSLLEVIDAELTPTERRGKGMSIALSA